MSAAEFRPLFDERLNHLFKLRTQLMRALKRAGDVMTIQHVADRVLDGRFQMWSAPESAIITEVVQFPLRKTLHYFLVVGDLEECLALQPEIEAFAKANGCFVVTCAGREGWDRILPRFGWKKQWSVLAKELV